MSVSFLDRGCSPMADPLRAQKILELVQRFFRRGNAWQILRVCGGGKRAFKEVFENYSLFEHVIAPILRNGGTLVDLCSGSTALLSLMAFIWTNADSIAVDVEKPSRKIRQFLCERFHYVTSDIFSEDAVQKICEWITTRPLVVAGVHCCGKLSFRVIEIGSLLNADYIVLVPCCVDRTYAERVLQRSFSGYADWIEALRRFGADSYVVDTFVIGDAPTNANAVLLFRRK